MLLGLVLLILSCPKHCTSIRKFLGIFYQPERKFKGASLSHSKVSAIRSDGFLLKRLYYEVAIICNKDMYHSNNIEYDYGYRIFTKWSIICIICIVTVIKIYLPFVCD